MKKLNIGLIGYGFMGRAHSNAFRKVSNFFDLDYQPVLKAVCARDEAKVTNYLAQQVVETSGKLPDAAKSTLPPIKPAVSLPASSSPANTQ